MKVLHFSDLHLGMENYGHIDPETGLSTRFSDWQKTMQQIVDYANEHDVDLVIFSGDAFKNRDPSPTYQNAFAQFIKKLSEPNRQVILLVGNHDLPNIEHKAHTLEIYNSLNLPRVHVSKRMESFKLETKSGPIQLVTWPWLTRNFLLKNEEYQGKSIEEIDTTLLNKAAQLFTSLVEQLEANITTIAIVHATIIGATFGSERNVMIGKDLVIPLSLLQQGNLAYVACGHLHKHQIIQDHPPVVYAGSPERIDFGEEKEEKGCVLVTIENNTVSNLKFLPTTARRFYTWRIREPFMPPESPLQEAIVKVVISGTRDFVNSIHLDSLQEYLKNAYYFAGIERDIVEEKKNHLGSQEFTYTKEQSPDERLKNYLTEKDIDKVMMEKVLNRAKEIFSCTKRE